MKEILVVEDNHQNMQLMEFLLRAFGHRPVMAATGADGVRLARERRPKLILMDIQMPEMDGYEVIREIKKDSALRTSRVVAVTAFAMAGDKQRVMDSGFDGYISKPIVPETFVGEIEAYLSEDLDQGPVR
jgi:two-component system cell cycle response regulator